MLKLNISSGNTSAKNDEILLDPTKKVNFLGRDVLQQLGIHLAQSHKDEKVMNILTSHNRKITHKIFKNFLLMCFVWDAKETIYQSPHSNNISIPHNIIAKVEKELKKLIEEKRLIKLEKRS